jgi:hypothetical protein
VKRNPVLYLLSPSAKSQPFKIEVSYDLLMLEFQGSKSTLSLEKSRFLSAYNMLEEKRGKWIRIGGSRINSDPDTLEGRIKSDFNGKMNGLSTAPWVAAILVKAFDNIHFNSRIKGQAIRLL